MPQPFDDAFDIDPAAILPDDLDDVDDSDSPDGSGEGESAGQEPVPRQAHGDEGLASRIAALERIEMELADVDRTLSRLDDGGYGSCAVCHQPIADERLAAEPTASTCAAHDVPASG